MLLAGAAGSGVLGAQQPAAPTILLDQSPRAVEYQLSRLTPEELVQIERKPGDAKYRPVFMALLTRNGVPLPVRQEALVALVELGVSRTGVLLEALARVADDQAAAHTLTGWLVAQPPTTLARDRPLLISTLDAAATPPTVARGAYAALLLAGDPAESLWQRARGREGHVQALLEAVRQLPRSAAANRVRNALEPEVISLLGAGGDSSTHAAALEALASIRPDAASFARLGSEVRGGNDPAVIVAALRGMVSLPRSTWRTPAVESALRGVIAYVQATAPDRRTDPEVVDAIQLGESLVAALPLSAARPLKRELHSLGVRVVRIETIVEQVLYDVRWFAVEAGRPVQVVFQNREAMMHNFVIGQPGALQEIGARAAAMPLPADPDAKAYVPDTPLVLAATHLLKEGELERLNFVAPLSRGEYVFLCTFPGHFTRMYGVMLVVDSLDAWEDKPTVPADPLTRTPFPSPRNVPAGPLPSRR